MSHLDRFLVGHSGLHQYRRLWVCQASEGGHLQPQAWLCALLQDLSDPEDADQIFNQLLDAGEFYLAAELVEDDDDGRRSEVFRIELRGRQAEFLEQVSACARRAERVGDIEDRSDEVLEQVEFRLVEAQAVLSDWEASVRQSEQRYASQLTEQAERFRQDGGENVPGYDDWRTRFNTCLVDRDFDTAEFLLKLGPTSMNADKTVVAPRPREWIWGTELPNALSWYLDDVQVPRGFRDNWLPSQDDTMAWPFIHALAGLSGATKPTAAAVMAFADRLQDLLNGEMSTSPPVQAEDGSCKVPLPGIQDPRLPATFGDHGEAPFMRVSWEQYRVSIACQLGTVCLQVAPTFLLCLLTTPFHRRLNLLRELGRQIPLESAVPTAIPPAILELLQLADHREYLVSLFDVLNVRTENSSVIDRMLLYGSGSIEMTWKLVRHLFATRQGSRAEVASRELAQVWLSDEFQREAYEMATRELPPRELSILGVCVFAGDGMRGETFSPDDVSVLAGDDFGIPGTAPTEVEHALGRLSDVGLIEHTTGGRMRIARTGVGYVVTRRIVDPVAFVAAIVQGT